MLDRSDGRIRRFIWFVGWPLRQLLILAVRGYQKWISPGLPSSCRYYPSCSAYAVQSLHHHGALKGLLLTTWRIMKCNPFSDGGVNPIPEKGKWRPEVGTNGEPRESDEPSLETASSGGESLEAASDVPGSQAIPDSEPGRAVLHTVHPDLDPIRTLPTDCGQTRLTTFSTLGV